MADEMVDPEDEEALEWETNLFDYLQTQYGHEIAQSTLGIINDFRKSSEELKKEVTKYNHEQDIKIIDKKSGHQKLYLVLQFALLSVIVASASTLIVMDKFSTVAGVFLEQPLDTYLEGEHDMYAIINGNKIRKFGISPGPL